MIGIFAILQAWLAMLVMGMPPTLSREMARFTGGFHDAQFIRNLLRSFEIIGVTTAILIALVVWLASGWLALNWLRVEKLHIIVVTKAFTLMGVLTALRFIENIYRSCIVGLQRQVVFNGIAIVMATLRGLGAVCILSWVSPTIEAFFIWQGIISILTVFLFASVLYYTLPVSKNTAKFSIKVLKEIKHFAMGMTAITFLAPLLTQVDKILLSKLLTLQSFGYYALAGTITNTLYMLSSPVTSAFYPRFSELVECADLCNLISAYHKSAQLHTVLIGTAAIVLIVFGDVLIELWTSNPELVSQVAPIVTVLTIGTLLNGLIWIPHLIQIAYGWTSLAVKVTVCTLLMTVPTILLVVPKYGAIGAAWVWVGLNTFRGTTIIFFMYRKLLRTEKWIWFWQDVVIPLAAGIMVAAPLRMVILSSSCSLTRFAGLIFSAMFILMVTALSAPFVRQQLLRYLRQTIKPVCLKLL